MATVSTHVTMEPVCESRQKEPRRCDIIVAARRLYERKGLTRTSIKDITDEVGVTRGLFYYYFPDKNAVTEAVIDDYAAEFAEDVRIWDESRTRGDIAGAVRSCVKLLRNSVLDARRFKASTAISEDSAIYGLFTQRIVDEAVRVVQSTTVEDYRRYHHIEIDYIYETFYMLINGLVALIKANPDIEDRVLETMIEQTLHLDIGEA